jgi:class 3 adenylate cyclase/tetratricopeptide (TPR) repeat protein
MRGPSGSRRCFVTVVRSDVEGSTRLGEQHDPELVREALGRFYEVATVSYEHHGGTIEQFQGDAVVAVFGLPHLHEDDALRAVRAAVELRDRMERLNGELQQKLAIRLPVKTAIHSGEVVAGNSPPGQLAGDVMNVVAHLEKLAQPGEILLGDATLHLVREAVGVDELGSLQLKSRKDPVVAHRLVRVLPEGWQVRSPIPLVGRERELAVLRATYERTVTSHDCHFLTLFGEAGVGKSRLVEQLLATVSEQATVLRSSSRSYGGAAYEAMTQLISEAAGLDPADPERAREILAGFVGVAQDADRITQRIGQVLGIEQGTGPPEDLHWALRRFLEMLALPRPLVVVLDDLHWADPALLDLVEEIAAASRGAPLMIVCTARGELLDRRSKWAGGAANTTTLRLTPLASDEVRRLVVHLLDGMDIADGVQDYVTDRSGGNPLFVQELVAMLRENSQLQLDEGQWRATTDLAGVRAPPNIRALLGARLDHLSGPERGVVERAAVIGRQFTAQAVRELSPPEARDTLAVSLRTLVGRDLIVPDEGALIGMGRDQGYAFTHALVQEVAFQAIAKETRAELDERYADWLERMGAGGVQVEEAVGNHLERAYRSLVEIGQQGEHPIWLARRAGIALATAGHRAAGRRDIPQTTVGLLERALALLVDNDQTRRTALLDLANALSHARRFPEAIEVYDRAVKEAEAVGDARTLSHGRVGALAVKHFSGRKSISSISGDEVTLEHAVQVFEREADRLGLATAWRLWAYYWWAGGLLTRAENCAQHAVELARQSQDEPLLARSTSTYCFILFWGPRHVDEVAREVGGKLDWARRRGVRSLEVDALRILARIRAMQGRFDEARQLLRETGEPTSNFGDTLVAVGGLVSAGLVELLAGQPAAADRILRRGHRILVEIGGQGQLLHVATLLARALALQGRDREAVAMTRECERLALEEQVGAQIQWRSIRATALVATGDHEVAERLSWEAVKLTRRWDQIDSTAEALADHADVLRRVGRVEEAVTHAQQALELYETKGNLVGAGRMRQFVEAGAA